MTGILTVGGVKVTPKSGGGAYGEATASGCAQIVTDNASVIPRCLQRSEILSATGLQSGQLGQGDLHVSTARLEVSAALGNLVEQVTELTRFAGAVVIHVDDRADLLEGEAQPLAAKDERKPNPVAFMEETFGTETLGCNEPHCLVVTKCPVGHAELLRDLGDGLRRVAVLADRGLCCGARGGAGGCHNRQRALR